MAKQVIKQDESQYGITNTYDDGTSDFIQVNRAEPKLGSQVGNKVDDTSDIGTINTNDAIAELNKGKEKLDVITGNNIKTFADGSSINTETGEVTNKPGYKPKETSEEKLKETNNLTFADAYELFGDDFSGVKKNADGTFSPSASAYERIGIKGMEETDDTQMESDLQELDNTITTLTNNFLSYNVQDDPDYQAEVQNINQQYDKMRANMEQVNTSRKRSLETLGYRTGSTQYAGAIQLGIVGEEIKQGDERIAEIVIQESAAISAARKSYKDGKYAEFVQQMDALDTLRDNKSEELTRYNEKLAEANKLIQEQEKQEFEVTKWLTDQNWKEKEMDLEYSKFAQTAEEFNMKYDLDVEKLGFDKAKFNTEFNFGIYKFKEDIRQFGVETTLDQLKLEIEQSDNDFDKQIKFQTLLSTLPEGQEINIGGMAGVGRKSDDLTIDQQLKLEKDGYYIDDNGNVKQKPADQATIDFAKDRIKIVDKLLEVDEGLDVAVGPNALARYSPFEWVTRKKGTFVSKVEQLINQESLDALIAAKAKGATFGALSDREMNILRSSASILSDRGKDEDGDGKTDYYEMRQDVFVEELNKFKNSAQKIIDYAEQERAEAGGQQIPPSKIIDDYYKENTNMRGFIDDLEAGGASEEQILKELGISFNQGEGGTPTALNKVINIKNGEKGGQCGRFVNKLTGLGLGDSYQSKIAKMDSSIKKPESGMVFVMPYKDTGHTGIILSVKNGIATVKDSNYSLDEKVKTHTIPVSKMTGFSYIT